MDITVKGADLARELANTDKVISKKVTIPVLANVLLVADESGVTMSATDLDAAMRCRLSGAAVAQRGTCTVPAQKLADIVRSLPQANVRLEVDGAVVKLTADGFKARLQTLPVADFPTLPTPPDDITARMPRAQLRDMVDRVRFCTDQDDKRFYLAGAFLEVSANAIEMAATDSHRLAVVSTPYVTGAKAAETAIVPRKALDALATVLDADVEGITYTRGENHLFFSVGTRLLVTRIVDGTFPQYKRMLPKQNAAPAAAFKRQPLLAALRRAVMVSPTDRKVLFALEKGALNIAARSAEFGDADERMEIGYDGVDKKVAFNGGYMADFLDAVKAEDVTVMVQSAELPVLCHEKAVGDVDYRYVVMPMRI